MKLSGAVTLLIALAILYLTLTPQELPAAPGGDKLHHLIAFAALCLPLAAVFPRNVIWLVPAAMLFGGTIEVLQPYVNRNSEWADFVADLLGITIGIIAGILINRIWVLEKE